MKNQMGDSGKKNTPTNQPTEAGRGGGKTPRKGGIEQDSKEFIGLPKAPEKRIKPDGKRKGM